MEKKIQIGVVGSMADQKLSTITINIARKIGREIARRNAILLYGYEGDHLSLPEIAAISAQKNNGQTIAFLWGKEQSNSNQLHSMRISTGQIRGGGRELALVLSCDVIIAIAGGAGTLTEIAIAYQANIPIIALTHSGGWSSQLSGTSLDHRKRSIIIPALSAKHAVDRAITATKEK